MLGQIQDMVMLAIALRCQNGLDFASILEPIKLCLRDSIQQGEVANVNYDHISANFHNDNSGQAGLRVSSKPIPADEYAFETSSQDSVMTDVTSVFSRVLSSTDARSIITSIRSDFDYISADLYNLNSEQADDDASERSSTDARSIISSIQSDNECFSADLYDPNNERVAGDDASERSSVLQDSMPMEMTKLFSDSQALTSTDAPSIITSNIPPNNSGSDLQILGEPIVPSVLHDTADGLKTEMTIMPGFFPELQTDVLIHGGTFTQVTEDVNHTPTGPYKHDNDLGLRALSKSIVAGALHDASERFPPPKCHPETRKKILALIMAWIEDPTHLEDILWLYGSAGSGKSAIMQTIAELCRSSNKSLGGTFFFSRGKLGREDSRLLFTTIAYQLALHVPGLGQYVNRAMLKDSSLDTKEISKQFKALIIEPFRKLALPRSQIYFVIIDGLDECQGFEVQRQILTLIAKSLAEANIPLRFLITSRPEAHLNETFRQDYLDCRTRRISLDSSVYNTERDIRLFLKAGFDTIAKRNEYIMARIEAAWPTESDIDHLVEKSSGQFIYPATVLKFVGAELHHPVKQLAIVLKPAPVSSTSTLYTNIDQLYTQILNTCPYPTILARILAVLLVLHCPQPPEVYDEILGFGEGDVTMTLRGLHSIVRFPNPEEDKRERREYNLREEYDQTRGLRLHHALFRDFLLDAHRCPKEFVVALDVAHGQVAQSGFKLATYWISSPWKDITDTKPPHRETWGYLKHHMSYHLDRCQPTDRAAIIEALNQFSVDFPAKARSEEKVWDHTFAAIHSLVTIFAMASQIISL
ncbi:hypothetical protein GALMADRAFT_1166879 [Galerina marginata CBS 339.88]|uniref:NACHT domain-containing protein n=1 Tax=Galerina marginata (strain CBS 339.88) TaxID=685588 RepID=A0A067TLP9_GALM3|nr:hypothetical protein GALMADRAFT_1166879 [Galerina marginata CBS 339.88]